MTFFAEKSVMRTHKFGKKYNTRTFNTILTSVFKVFDQIVCLFHFSFNDGEKIAHHSLLFHLNQIGFIVLVNLLLRNSSGLVLKNLNCCLSFYLFIIILKWQTLILGFWFWWWIIILKIYMSCFLVFNSISFKDDLFFFEINIM